MHGPLDVISPDEITIGHGRTTGLMNGGYSGHNDMFEYEGESNSTYAALTWDIPSFQDPALTREERRAIREENLNVEPEAEPSGWGMTTLDGEDPVVPDWLPLVLGGVVVIVLIAGFLNGRKKPQW